MKISKRVGRTIDDHCSYRPAQGGLVEAFPKCLRCCEAGTLAVLHLHTQAACFKAEDRNAKPIQSSNVSLNFQVQKQHALAAASRSVR